MSQSRVLLPFFCAFALSSLLALSGCQSTEQSAETTSQPSVDTTSARPVAERLAKLRAESEGQIGPEFVEAGRLGTQQIAESGILERALNVGDTIPAFALPDAYGTVVRSDSLLSQGPLVVIFYRGEWCPFCNLYLRSLQEYLPQFEELGATLVAISGEKPDNTAKVQTNDSLTYPVLSDTGLVAARKFGIVSELPQVVDTLIRSRGFDMAAYYGTEKAELPLAVTYVVDRNGVIVYAFLDADYKVRAEPAEVLAALRRLNRS